MTDPFHPGARLYRTGDTVRYRPDGQIECLGRNDHQIKLRGFRIELGEIEATLAQHPAVKETVVVAHDAAPGDRRLVAYITRDAHTPAAAEQSGTAYAERVAQWEAVWEETYRRTPPGSDPTLTSWVGVAANRPADPGRGDARVVDGTAALIGSLRPRRILEIGCGSGLLLFRLAPECDRYTGTDFSQAALSYIGRHLPAALEPRVSLLRRMAHDFSGVPEHSFDAVVLNSVIQYFPGIDYASAS